jgi:spore maturation protein CgeB
MRAQQQVYGVDLMRPALRSDVLDAMFSALPLQPRGDSVETKEYLYDDYVLSRKLTSVERTEYLAAIGEKHPISVYTKDAGFSVNGITNKGMVMYYTEMPLVFKCSKINLNISLRSIRDGIPLRCFDIMGAGGFLLTNFQSDLLRFFEPDKDFVYFESEADLLAKVDYYLAHPEEREAIARNGYNKIRDGHTFDHRVHEMMEIITAS